MPATDREHDEAELRDLEWRLSDVEASGRQTTPTEAGKGYRASLRADIARLRERLASEEG